MHALLSKNPIISSWWIGQVCLAHIPQKKTMFKPLARNSCLPSGDIISIWPWILGGALYLASQKWCELPWSQEFASSPVIGCLFSLHGVLAFTTGSISYLTPVYILPACFSYSYSQDKLACSHSNYWIARSHKIFINRCRTAPSTITLMLKKMCPEK